MRHEQDRRGNPERRRLEAAVVAHHLSKNKEAFAARLKRILQPDGECMVATVTRDRNGYPRMNFRYKGRHVTIHVMRVVAIMRNKCQPIPLGYDVGHLRPDVCSRACCSHVALQHYTINAATNKGSSHAQHG